MDVRHKKVDSALGQSVIFDVDTLDLLSFISDIAGIDGDILVDSFYKTVSYDNDNTLIDKNKFTPLIALFQTHKDKIISLYNQVDNADLNQDLNEKKRLFLEITAYKNVVKEHILSQLTK